jgi:hypothetical protein
MTIENYLQKLQDMAAGGIAGGMSTGGTGVSAAAGLPGIDSPGYEKVRKKKRKILGIAYPNEAVQPKLYRRVMVDFDKTIYEYTSGWNDGLLEDDPFPDSRSALKWLKSKGFEIVIFTTRASEEAAKESGGNVVEQIRNLENWLSNYDIPYDRITAEKLAADFYIDDKAVHIKDGNWIDVIKEIKDRMSHYGGLE